MLFAILCVPSCFATDAAEANNAISQAESDLDSAYVAVAQAESAGADVSALLNKLESASDFLSKANFEFMNASYATASALATECSASVAGVADDAAVLKMDSEREQSGRLFLSVVVSSLGLVLLLGFGLLGWKLLKRRYHDAALNMKPQLEESA
jgi:hypothetical protein